MRQDMLAFLLWLQIACLGLFGRISYVDSIAFGDISFGAGKRLAPGRCLPEAILYGENGWERVSFRSPTVTGVILSGCAPCNRENVQAWNAISLRRNEQTVMVLETTPEQLALLRRQWGLKGKLYANAKPSFYNRYGVERLPVYIRVLPGGTVTHVEYGR